MVETQFHSTLCRANTLIINLECSLHSNNIKAILNKHLTNSSNILIMKFISNNLIFKIKQFLELPNFMIKFNNQDIKIKDQVLTKGLKISITKRIKQVKSRHRRGLSSLRRHSKMWLRHFQVTYSNFRKIILTNLNY